MNTRSIAAVVLATSAALLLAGCTADSDNSPSPKPTASEKAAPSDEYTPAAYQNACDGTQAVLDHEGGEHSLEDGCESVSVVGSGSKYTIGATNTLTVEGDNLDIRVEKVDKILLLGANNKVHVTDGEPAVDDQGSGNTID
ncbi:DUF3060 domain-containing protein [Curtobacterium sp. SP.BCp]|uniref:DUF3060 domain-containing protein n=1 Tax=Curtobacterium sp. SP.BCp TaxID=3435230 RepID=UPI003F73AF35